MNEQEIIHQEEDRIIEVLPSGVKMIITGTPSIENCKDFLKILLRANSKVNSEST